jgi:multiple sugar transport system substrate-binding protein
MNEKISLHNRNRTELNFWVMPNVGFSTRPILETYIQQFENQNPDVKIQLKVLPWSLAWNRLMDVIKNRGVKNSPDILQIGTTWVTTLSYLGALERMPDVNGYKIGSVEDVSIGDSSPFCVPWFVDIRVLYYRKDILNALKLDPRLLENWEGFNHICSEIQRNLLKNKLPPQIIAPLGIPGQKPGVLMHDLAPWVWEAGGDFCSEDSKEATLSQASIRQGCEFYFDLIANGYMPILNSALPQGNFFTGHYAMQFSGSWPVDAYLNTDSPYANPDVARGFDVALLPSGPQGRFTFLGGSNLAVASISQNKELAWKFIQFMSEPTRLLSHARAIGALPPQLTTLGELFSKFPGAKNVFLRSFSYARRLPRLIELGSLEQIVYKMSHRILACIREQTYSHKILEQEINSANNEIKTLLSIHRYGTKSLGRAA